MNIQEGINWIKDNWNNLDKYKVDLVPKMYDNIEREKKIVILLLDRQKPSVQASYDYDMERIGIDKDGNILWGFDSGCSCPTPFVDNYYEDMYKLSKTWKDFEVNLSEFDEGIIEECMKTINDIMEAKVK